LIAAAMLDPHVAALTTTNVVGVLRDALLWAMSQNSQDTDDEFDSLQTPRVFSTHPQPFSGPFVSFNANPKKKVE